MNILLGSGIFINVVHLVIGLVMSLQNMPAAFWVIYTALGLLLFVALIYYYFKNSKKYIPLLQLHVAIAILFIINAIALYIDLYPKIPWFDVPMHFIGGALTAALLLIFIAELKLSQPKKIVYVLMLTFLVGVVWECTEFLAHHFIDDVDFFIPGMDVVSDLILDMIGAIATLIWYKKK